MLLVTLFMGDFVDKMAIKQWIESFFLNGFKGRNTLALHG